MRAACTILRDLFVTLVFVAAFYYLSTFYRVDIPLEKGGETDPGLHLLSCPQIFKDEGANAYLDLHMSVASQERLLDAIQESRESSHIFHTKKGLKTGVPNSLQTEIDVENGYDVNVPATADNERLCNVIQSILDEQQQHDNSEEDSEEEVSLSVSILKLKNDDKANPLLRGVQLVKASVSNFLIRIRKETSTSPSGEQIPTTPVADVRFADQDEVVQSS